MCSFLWLQTRSATLTLEACAIAACVKRSMSPLVNAPRVHSQAAVCVPGVRGDMVRSAVLAPPALFPNTVTRRGSPRNAAMCADTHLKHDSG